MMEEIGAESSKLKAEKPTGPSLTYYSIYYPILGSNGQGLFIRIKINLN